MINKRVQLTALETTERFLNTLFFNLSLFRDKMSLLYLIYIAWSNYRLWMCKRERANTDEMCIKDSKIKLKRKFTVF